MKAAQMSRGAGGCGWVVALTCAAGLFAASPASGRPAGVIPDNGPFAGGNTITIINSGFGEITNVMLGGVQATIQSADSRQAVITAPAADWAGVKDIVMQTSDNGDITLAWAYTYNPAGQIGWDPVPGAWTNLYDGLNGEVFALAHDGTNLYVGGAFTTAGGVTANYVAMWNGSSWTNLGSGMDGAVYAFAFDGANLYAGGAFTTAGGEPANYVAMWDGSSWTSLGAGMDGWVYALAHDGADLYAGGYFTTAGGTAAQNIARWDGENWASLGDGTDGAVYALTHDGTNLYAGGPFQTAGGELANYVAKWNGADWATLGDGTDGAVYALTHDGADLYAGGYFTTAGGMAASNIARWDGENWLSLGDGTDGAVYALTHDGTNLYAGGVFTTADGTAAQNIALWDGADWLSLGDGTDNAIYTLEYDGAHLFAGGAFMTAGGVAVQNIAMWRAPKTVSGVEPSSGFWTGGHEVVISGPNLGNGADITDVTICGVAAAIQSQSATQVVVVAGQAAATGPGGVRVVSTSYGETVKSQAFTYLKTDQTIDFPMIGDPVETDVVGMPATASSGLAVSFTVLDGPASLDATGTNLTFTGAGLVSVLASQPGNGLWNSAPEVTRTFLVRGVYSFAIQSDHGLATPAMGTYAPVEGTVLTNVVSALETIGATQFVCVGWTLTGNNPPNGTTTQCVVTVTNNAVLTWLWTTNYRLTTAAGPHGSVDVGSGWQPSGTTTRIRAVADAYYHFTNWTGSVVSSDNPLDLLMDAPKSLTANFVENRTTNRPTPEWWLAQFGLTNNFETAVGSDPDGDGVPTGDEWVMGTDPTNRLSVLHVSQMNLVYGLKGEVVGHQLVWPCSSGRVYAVQYTPVLSPANWLPVDGLTNLAPVGTPITVTNLFVTPGNQFYRLKVRLP